MFVIPSTHLGSFNPAQIPNMGVWFDADDSSTITHVSGKVSLWKDKGPLGFNVSQASDPSKPITGTRTLNGRNTLDFQGGSMVLTAASAIFGLGMTMVAWVKVDTPQAGANIARITCNRGGGGGHVFGTRNTNETVFLMESGTVTDFVRRNSADNVINTTNGYMLAVTHDGTSTGANIHLFVNNVETGYSLTQNSAVAPVGNSANFTIGNDASAISGFDGQIAEICGYKAVLTTAQLAQLAAYGTAKWGKP